MVFLARNTTTYNYYSTVCLVNGQTTVQAGVSEDYDIKVIWNEKTVNWYAPGTKADYQLNTKSQQYYYIAVS